jgi:hypothetical protein
MCSLHSSGCNVLTNHSRISQYHHRKSKRKPSSCDHWPMWKRRWQRRLKTRRVRRVLVESSFVSVLSTQGINQSTTLACPLGYLIPLAKTSTNAPLTGIWVFKMPYDLLSETPLRQRRWIYDFATDCSLNFHTIYKVSSCLKNHPFIKKCILHTIVIDNINGTTSVGMAEN